MINITNNIHKDWKLNAMHEQDSLLGLTFYKICNVHIHYKGMHECIVKTAYDLCDNTTEYKVAHICP
jgi:hypothetical protein